MSITVMSALWKTCLYQGNTLNVLLAMADWAEDDGGDIFPGIEMLAAKARASVRTTQMALRQLEADRIVERIANPKGGRGKITEYKIDLERVQELQGFHQEENPDCEHCQAKRRSAEKRVQHRQQRVQASVGKGATSVQKGAEPREHIDNTHQQPSDTHHSQAPAGAGESDGIASLGEGSPERWLEFRSRWAQDMPEAFPAVDEKRARDEFVHLTRRVAPDILIAAVGLHGAAETRRYRQRAGKDYRTKYPSTWLRDGGWEGYARQASEIATREQGHALALGRISNVLPPDMVKLLRERGMPDASLAMLDGMEFEPGPPPCLVARAGVQRVLLEKHLFALERKFGEGLKIILAGERRRA